MPESSGVLDGYSMSFRAGFVDGSRIEAFGENKLLIKSIDIVGIWIYDEIEIEIERRRWTA